MKALSFFLSFILFFFLYSSPVLTSEGKNFFQFSNEIHNEDVPGLDICSAQIITESGEILETFSGRGFTYYKACQRALKLCRYSLEVRFAYGLSPYSRCEIVGGL